MRPLFMMKPMHPPLFALFSRQAANDWSTKFLNGCSQIFLQRHPGCGALCLLAVAWGATPLLGGMLLGTFSSWLTAKRRHYSQLDRDNGLYGYNGALLGLLISAQWAWSPLLPLLIMLSSGLSSLLLNHWLRHNRKYASWPAYTAPFVLLAWLLLALSDSLQLSENPVIFSRLYANVVLDIPLAVLLGLSQVLLVNDAFSGALILLGLWLANRRTALWAVAGSCLGLLLASLLGQASEASQGLYGFNGVLLAIALSQQSRSAGLIFSAILLATLLQFGASNWGLSHVLSAPFVLNCWLLQSRLGQWPRRAMPASKSA